MEGEEEETEERIEALRLNDTWRRPSEFSSSETVSRNGSRSGFLFSRRAYERRRYGDSAGAARGGAKTGAATRAAARFRAGKRAGRRGVTILVATNRIKRKVDTSWSEVESPEPSIVEREMPLTGEPRGSWARRRRRHQR